MTLATKVYLGSTLLPSTGGVATDQNPSRLLDDGVVTASSVRSAVSCTASATPHTAGTWVEVDPSLSADAAGVVFTLTAATFLANTNSSTLLDIGTGAAASETVWATVGVGYQNASATVPGTIFTVPGLIASGTRVSVRCRSAVASQVVSAVYAFRTPKSIVPPAPTTIGANTGTSQGITLTAPGSLNTKGAWTELSASTGSAFSALGVFAQAAGGSGMASAGVLVDIGVGAAASETVLISDLYLQGNSAELYVVRSPMTYGVAVAAGSRLSARYARANTGNAVDLVIVCA